MSAPLSLYFILSPPAAGNKLIDPRDPTGGSVGGGCRAGCMGLARATSRLENVLPSPSHGAAVTDTLVTERKYDVKVFSTFGQKTQVVDGVEYVRLTEMHKYDAPDVVLAYYDVQPLIGNPAGLRIASHHTLLPYHAWPWADVNTAPCDWARDYLREHYRPQCRWATLPNAVEGFEGVVHSPVDGRVLYHTSPDRGLHLLLGAWPEIRARVPGATLHVAGAPEDIIGQGDSDALIGSYEHQRAQELKAGLKAAEAAGGLNLLGRLPRPALLREVAEAACVAFPFEVSSPTETFSISVLESMVVGVPVVISPVDALESIYGRSGAMVCHAPARRHMNEFCSAVETVLTDPEVAAAMGVEERDFASGYSFERSADVLDRIVAENYPVRAPIG